MTDDEIREGLAAAHRITKQAFANVDRLHPELAPERSDERTLTGEEAEEAKAELRSQAAELRQWAERNMTAAELDFAAELSKAAINAEFAELVYLNQIVHTQWCREHPEEIKRSEIRQKLIETETGVYDPDADELHDPRFQAALLRRAWTRPKGAIQ